MSRTAILIALVATGLLAGLVGVAQAQTNLPGTVSLENSPPNAPAIEVDANRSDPIEIPQIPVTIPLDMITDPNNDPLTLTFTESDYTPPSDPFTFAEFSDTSITPYTNLTLGQDGTYTVDADQASFSFVMARGVVPNGAHTISYTVTDGEASETGTITINVSGTPPSAQELNYFVSHPGEVVVGFGRSATDQDDGSLGTTLTFTPRDMPADFDTYLEVTEGASDDDNDGTYDVPSDTEERLVKIRTVASGLAQVILDYTIDDGADTASSTVTITVLDPSVLPLQDVTYMVPAVIDSQFTHTLDQDEIQSLVTIDLSDTEIRGFSLDVNRPGDMNGFASITGTNTLARTLTYDPDVDDSAEDEVFTYWGNSGGRLGAATITFDRGNTCTPDIPTADLEFGDVKLGVVSQNEVMVEISNAGHSPFTVMLSGEEWLKDDNTPAMAAEVTAYDVASGVDYAMKTKLTGTATALEDPVGLNDDVTLYMNLLPILHTDVTAVGEILTQQITVSTTCTP